MYVLILLYLTLKNNNESNNSQQTNVPPTRQVVHRNIATNEGATVSRVAQHKVITPWHNTTPTTQQPGVAPNPVVPQQPNVDPKLTGTQQPIFPPNQFVTRQPNVDPQQLPTRTGTNVTTNRRKRLKALRTLPQTTNVDTVPVSSGVERLEEQPSSSVSVTTNHSFSSFDSSNSGSDDEKPDAAATQGPSNANKTTNEMDEFFLGYKSPPFSRASRAGVDISLVRQDFNDNVLTLTQTSDNLMTDVQETIKAENVNMLGLGWFGKMETGNIEHLLRNINRYKDFVNRNVTWALFRGYGWDPLDYKKTLETNIHDIIIDSRTKEMLQRPHIIDINMFPTFQDWEAYQQNKLPFVQRRQILLNLIYQFSEDFQKKLSQGILLEQEIMKTIHEAFSKYLLSLGEYNNDENITDIINKAIANENAEEYGLKWFCGKKGIRNIPELYDAINLYNNNFTPGTYSYDAIEHYDKIKEHVTKVIGEIQDFHNKYQQYIKLPDIGNPTHIDEINRLVSQHKKCVRILNKHVFYMELIMLMLRREFKPDYTGICFTKEKDRTEYYASLNGKLHDVGTLEKIIEIFYGYSKVYSSFSFWPNKRKWFKDTFLNTHKDQTWDGFTQEFATKLSQNMKNLDEARKKSNVFVGPNESNTPEFNEALNAKEEDFTCPTIGS
jgi:hypothetical protein